jgi:hypothetical protein
VNFSVGVVMILTAVLEISGEVLSDVLHLSLGAEHGLILVGLLHAAKALPELIDGVEKVDHARGDARPSAPPARDGA